MPMLDLSQFGLPTLPNGMLSPTGAFPAAPPVDEAALAQAAREDAATRLGQGPIRAIPPMAAQPPADTFGMPGGPMPFGSLAPQTEAPSAPTLPPWLMEMASAGPSKAGPVASPMTPAVDPAALPPNATPTMGEIPPGLPKPDNVGPRVPLTPQAQPMAADVAAPPAAASPSLLDRLSAASHNLGARPGLPGIFDAISGASTGTRMDPVGRQLQAENQTTQALIKKGIEPDMASAIAKNPTLMQQIVPQLFGPKKYEHVMMKDAFGNEIPLSYDPSTGKYIGSGGQNSSLIGGGTAPGGASGVPEQPGFYAKGVTQINHDLIGKPYLDQFSPEVQRGVENYLDGKTLTTGNARQGFTQTVKMIAQKYGAEIGKPADDIAINGRRQMTTDLAKGTPGSLGGQLTFGGTSLGHLADVAEKATRMNNVSGFGVAPLADLANKFRGLTTEQASKVNEVDGAVQHYGQEITKFYTGSPGGEAERMRFLKTIGTSKSPLEIAGAIRTERDLIPDRLRQVEAQIAERLGPEEAAKQMKRVDIAGVTDKINRSLAKLDPSGPEAKMLGGQPSTAPAAAPAPGKYVYDPASGKLVPQQ
jgi:hypothetical protein